MNIIDQHYQTIRKTIDCAINSMRIVLPFAITVEDCQAQAFYQICKKIDKYDAEKGTINQYCYRVAQNAIINFLMRVAPYKYRRSREIAISNNVNICKVKELNFAALTDNMLLQKDSIDQIETEDIFRKVIANLKTRQRFLAIMTYRQGWNIQDIMQHYKIDYRRARDYRLYMQRRFKKELKAIEKVI